MCVCVCEWRAAKQRGNELWLCRLRHTRLSLAPVSSVCEEVFSSAGRFTLRECQFPFVDPWERSSISLLGTTLMRPGILPFIPHSLQLGTAHSFHYGHSGVLVYRRTMWWARSANYPRSSLGKHAIPYIPGKLYFPGFAVLTSNRSHYMLCSLMSSQLKKNSVPENTAEGHMVTICRFSWLGVYNIPEVKEEKEKKVIYLMPTRSIFMLFLPAFMLAAYLMILAVNSPQRPIFFLRMVFLHRFTFIWAFRPFLLLLLLSDQCRIEAQPTQKPH